VKQSDSIAPEIAMAAVRAIGGDKPERTLRQHPDFASRFWSKVEFEPNTGCWLWSRSTDRHGYGNVNVFGRYQRAHRVAYALARGPLPDVPGYHGAVVMHRCDTPLCCNPDHLSVGTQKANLREMGAKGRQWKTVEKNRATV